MSAEISRKLLKPRTISLLRRAYSMEKPRVPDRPYSTAFGIMPEIYDETAYEHSTEKVDFIPKEYSEIPGPKELPIIGNAWRFAPVIGQYKIHELDKVMWSLRREYGRIVKVGGLIGHPDLLFVFDGDDIQKVFRREEGMPHRPSMPSLHYYKQHLQKSFFEGNEGVIGVHGPKWDAFRKQVQQILLPPATAKKYIDPLDAIASDFLVRYLTISIGVDGSQILTSQVIQMTQNVNPLLVHDKTWMPILGFMKGQHHILSAMHCNIEYPSFARPSEDLCTYNNLRWIEQTLEKTDK